MDTFTLQHDIFGAVATIKSAIKLYKEGNMSKEALEKCLPLIEARVDSIGSTLQHYIEELETLQTK